MDEQPRPFRFLSDGELTKLDREGKAAYLSSASHELEQRQGLIREQIKSVKKKPKL